MNNGFIPDIRKYNQVLYTNDRNQVKTDTDDILAIKEIMKQQIFPNSTFHEKI